MEKQKPLSFHNIEMFSKEADELIQDRVTYKAELKDLAAKLLRLIADNENGQTRIKDALVGNASREKLVKSLQTDVFIYRKRLASIGSMKKVADEYDRQETEIRQLKERSENAVKSIETYETDINSFDEIMSAGKVRLETLRSDIAGLEKEKATLTTEISEIKNVSDIFVKKAEMEKEFLLLTEKRDSNLQQIDAVNAKLSENEGVLPGLRSTVESLTKELASLEKKRQESKDYLEQQEALSTELTELGAKKRAIEFSLESLDTTQEELTAKLEGEKAKNEETKIESEILKKQLKEFYNEIGALNREKAKIELTIRENEGVFKGIKSYFQENKYIEAEIETMEELFEKNYKYIEDITMGKFVEQDITYTKEDIHRLIGIFGENVVHKMRKANLEAEIHEITKELNYYKERIDRAELKNRETEKSLKEHESLSSEMDTQIAHLSKEKGHLENEIEKYADIEQKAAELIDRDALIYSLKKDVGISEGKAKHLKQEHDKISAERTRSENLISETQKRFDVLTADTTKLRETLAFQKSVIPPYGNMKELQQYKDEAQSAITEFKKSTESVNKEIAKSAETLSMRTGLYDKAEQELKTLNATKEKLEKEIAEITGFETVEELQKAVEELKSHRESMTEAIAALESTKVEKEGKIKKTELQIKEEGRAASVYEKTVADHNAKREEVRVLKEEVSLKELEIGVTERLTEFSVPIEEFLKLNHKALKSISDKYDNSLISIKNIFGELL